MASQNGDVDHMSISTDLMESTYLIDQSDLASQHSHSTIGGSSTLRDGPRLRVYITLGNGERLLVPVPQRATVQDLQFAALRRAARLGITATLADTVLRTVGPHAAVIDGDDLVQDFIDLTQDSTFSLEITGATQVAGSASSVSLPILTAALDQRAGDPSSGRQSIYVRWITTHEAINVSRLDKLPIDTEPFDANTSLSEFGNIAVQRLCHGQSTLSARQANKVNLWLKECQLATRENTATLAGLGLSGTIRRPLDIFVQFFGDQELKSLSQVSESVTPQVAWGFNTTLRGFSTFVTSLSILLEEIERGNIDLDTVLDALLEVTHFPPAVLALQTVYDKGLQYGIDAHVESLLLLADLFNSVCKSMVPDWICNSDESKLEGSRQIMSWFHTLCLGSKQLTAPKCVYRIQTFQIPTMDIEDPTAGALFSHTEVMQLPPSVTESAAATTTSGSAYVVSVEGPGEQLTPRLALALRCDTSARGRWEYYFHRTEDWTEFIGRPALHRPGPADFDNLLTDANVYPAFKMIDPMQLGACLSADLPVITLSGSGFVSLYDQEDIACGEREFYMHNVVERKVKIDKMDPGQFISQKLEPVILERKKHGSWEVDAWSEWLETANHGEPDESIVICIDTSSSMNAEMHGGWNLRRDGLGQSESRLHEVKEFFQQFSTRLSSYSLSTNVGLVTFSGVGKVNVVQPLTMLQLDFRDKLAAVNARGSTAVFNALSLANSMLMTQKASFPKTKCRIILLTDGEDNSSNMAASFIADTLHNNDIVLDAIVIGSDSTSELFKISRSTGGYAFHPQTQHIFFQIFLLETFIDIRTRPDIEKVTSSDWASFQPKPADMRDPFSFPPCRPHPNQQDYFISLGSAHKFLRRKTAKSHAYSSAASTASTLRSSRTSTSGGPRILLSEVKAMIDNSHPRMDVYVSQSNIGFWKVIMEGPEGSPYETGTFLLYVDIGNDFPRTPPAVRFITQILHPNISKHGRVCHPIFDREWNPHMHVYEVMQHIFGMLMSLESRDAIDPISALKFYTDPEEGRQQVAAYIRKFARQGREDLSAKILNGTYSSTASSYGRSAAGESTATLTPGASDVSHQSSVPSSRQTITTTGAPNAPPRGGTDNAASRRREVTSSTLPPSLASSQGSLASYLAARRGINRGHQSVLSSNQGPAPPPLLIAQSDEATQQSVVTSSMHSLPLTASNLAAIPGSTPQKQASPSGNQNSVGGSEIGSRRLSRRASFFAKLRRAGN